MSYAAGRRELHVNYVPPQPANSRNWPRSQKMTRRSLKANEVRGVDADDATVGALVCWILRGNLALGDRLRTSWRFGEKS